MNSELCPMKIALAYQAGKIQKELAVNMLVRLFGYSKESAVVYIA